MAAPSGAATSPLDATERLRIGGERALVLGGGGSTGNAWLIGILAGLSDAGIDVTDADLIVGTSAGATAAAQITGAPLADLLGTTLTPPPPQAARPGAAGGRPSAAPVTDHLERLNRLIASSSDQADFRRRISAAALELDAASDGLATARWRSMVAARLPRPTWPDRPVGITAVDARTGDPVVFDRRSGVDFVDAVAASTSSGVPFRIGDGRYLDGGYRINAENADLASGFARVLVLSPFGGRSLAPAGWGTHLAAQIENLRTAGTRVEVLSPDHEAEQLFGPNGMDFSLRAPAARTGFEQGARVASETAAFWH